MPSTSHPTTPDPWPERPQASGALYGDLPLKIPKTTPTSIGLVITARSGGVTNYDVLLKDGTVLHAKIDTIDEPLLTLGAMITKGYMHARAPGQSGYFGAQDTSSSSFSVYAQMAAHNLVCGLKYGDPLDKTPHLLNVVRKEKLSKTCPNGIAIYKLYKTYVLTYNALIWKVCKSLDEAIDAVGNVVADLKAKEAAIEKERQAL
ncbi:hypothetical protein sr16906 [Sporisorium reilianum SRZ2]|uniref:Uncharacterized protein n=1 Tax=Sporisorium reilianum (strain SRZ2) TaxID=999809 RepID=E6ZV63_SPORE|nr:hypothetical protein sr16906 [Sporisorium reilianum SRZ2]